MAYSAMDLMEKANHIYEIEELSLGRQLLFFLIWFVECMLVLALVLSIMD